MPAAVDAFKDLAPALKRLCAMKLQAQFTPFVLETWCATLSRYPPHHVVRAIIECGLSLDPFPDLAKVVERTRQIVEAANPQPSLGTRKPGVFPVVEVCEIGEALGLLRITQK